MTQKEIQLETLNKLLESFNKNNYWSLVENLTEKVNNKLAFPLLNEQIVVEAAVEHFEGEVPEKFKKLTLVKGEVEEGLHKEEEHEDKECGLTKMLNAIRSDLQDELEAIKNYDEHAVKAEAHGYDEVAEVLRDIRDEEKVHCGELQKLLDKYDAQFEKSIEDGKKEVEEEKGPIDEETEVADESVLELIESLVSMDEAATSFKFSDPDWKEKMKDTFNAAKEEAKLRKEHDNLTPEQKSSRNGFFRNGRGNYEKAGYKNDEHADNYQYMYKDELNQNVKDINSKISNTQKANNPSSTQK